jgi:kynurenine formamidase
MRLIDLSVTIEQDAVSEIYPPKIEFRSHTGAGLEFFMGALGVKQEDLVYSGGTAPGDEIFTFMSHTGTHVDAPFHYGPQSADGSPALSIDELPLEWFFAPSVVLDFHERADGEVIEAADLEAALAKAQHDLAPLDIVLVRTGCDAFLAEPDYIARGPGVSAAATHWLYDRGVRVMGIDAWGWDRPLWMQAEEAKAQQQPGIFWAAHQADLAYSQIERLANLDRLPASGFRVCCFPLRLVGGSAAPARVVAILDD